MNAEPEKKGFQAPPKKTLMIGGAAVVVVIAAVAAFSMFSGGGSGADYGLYLKDDQLVYTTLKEEGDWMSPPIWPTARRSPPPTLSSSAFWSP